MPRLLRSTFYSLSNLYCYALSILFHQSWGKHCNAYSYHPSATIIITATIAIAINDCDVWSNFDVRTTPFDMFAEKRSTFAYKWNGLLHRHDAVLPELFTILKQILGAHNGKRKSAIGSQSYGQSATYAKVLNSASPPWKVELDISRQGIWDSYSK